MSYALFSMNDRKARKQHRCIWCGQAIKPGDHYIDERSVYDGAIQRHRWHPECRGAADDYFRDFNEEEFTPYDNERPLTPAAEPWKAAPTGAPLPKVTRQDLTAGKPEPRNKP